MRPSSVVAASDAGLGLQHAFKEQNIPVAPARHNLDEMSPVKRIEGSGLQASQRKLLQRLAKHAACGKESPGRLFGGGRRQQG